jgi:hypothetical protein
MEKDIIAIVAITAAAVLIANQLVRLLQSMMLHRTVREALVRDSALAPELLDRIDRPKRPSGGDDDRTGLLLIALGAAMIAFAFLQGSPDTIHNVTPLSVFPLFVGAMLCGRHWVLRRRGADS